MNKAWLKSTLELLLKLALIGVAAYFIFSKLQSTEYHGVFTYIWHDPYIYLSVFFALWVANLLFDAIIWQVVNNFVETISLKRAFKTNFICYALAFITPANSGELAGRYIMLNQKGDRQKTVFLTFWSHFPRFITKFLLGGSALLLLAYYESRITLVYALLGILLISVVLITIYLSILKIQKWLNERNAGKWDISKYILNNRPILSEKITLLFLSIGKYLSYNLQFIGLLAMWNPEILGIELFLSVIVFYFITALIPTFAAADFIIKGALAIYIFDSSLASEAELINASFIIWIFNIALPALFGTGIILKTNLLHSIKMRFSRGNRYGL
ncbi:hypothetical protein [Owenweeksia hongkongensis]|uniref:hypothetical protein n=1 Tax=Owenweeksia hongkongensis TaxID=253245 RepID=UPI003A8D5E8D